MPATLDLATIAGNVFDYWELNFPHDVATAYPGVPIDTQNLSEWVDLEIPEFSPCVGRDSSPSRSEILLKVNVFVRRSTDLARINALTDAALAVMSRVTIPLYTPDSIETLLGYVQLLDGRVQNQTRQDRESRRHDLQHVAIAVQGIVQEVLQE